MILHRCASSVNSISKNIGFFGIESNIFLIIFGIIYILIELSKAIMEGGIETSASLDCSQYLLESPELCRWRYRSILEWVETAAWFFRVLFIAFFYFRW